MSGVVSFLVSLLYGAAWWQAGLLAGLLVPGVYLSLLLIRVGIRKWASTPQPPPNQTTAQLSDETLRERCCKLSAEINEFYLRQRQHMEDILGSEYWDRIFDIPVREQKRADEIARHDRWIVDEYRRKFGSKMRTLSNDLAQAQAITPEDQDIFKNPTKRQDVQCIAERLGEICNRSDPGNEIQWTAAAKRKAVKDLLGNAMKEGQGLRSSHKQERREKHDAARDWVGRTHDLIEAAFDKAEAQYFRGDQIDRGLDPVDGCLSRLEQLMVRANSLDINPDFDPQEWKGGGERA